MVRERFCERCGIRLKATETPKSFEFGFRELILELCNPCKGNLEKRHMKIQEKYKGKMLKLFSKFYTKLLR